MEFGIFIQSFVPDHLRKDDPLAEHKAIMNDIECAIAADKAGFKYVWVTEHHFHDEYSNLSANEVVMGHLAHTGEIPRDEDVAEAVEFFLSDRARMISGQRLLVNAAEYF